MEYILYNTDIFDGQLVSNYNQLIKENKESFTADIPYKLTVTFHVNLLSDPRFAEFVVPVPSKTNKETKEDKISDVLRYQLSELEQILNKYGIDVYSATIQGEYLEVEDMIKIEIIEDTSEPCYTGRGKNKKRMKINSIIPNLPYIQEQGAKVLAEIFAKQIFEEMKQKQFDKISD